MSWAVVSQDGNGLQLENVGQFLQERGTQIKDDQYEILRCVSHNVIVADVCLFVLERRG